MRRILLVAAVVGAGALAWGGEVGAQFEVGERASGIGWVQLSGGGSPVQLSGRIEGDLLCGCLRRAQFGASTVWGGWAGGVEAVGLASGRVDASATGSWKAVTQADLGLVSAQVGGKATTVDVLGGRFLTAAGWAFGRLDADPWWVEVSGNAAWPGGSPHAELRLGLTGPMWATLSLSDAGTGLELGSGPPELSIQTYLSLRPALQTVTIGLGRGGVRLQFRLTVRGEGSPSGSLTLTATAAPWLGTVVASLSGRALEKVSVEIRYTLGTDP